MQRLVLTALSVFLACSCAMADTHEKCDPTPEVTITYGDAHIVAHPACVRVKQGKSITIWLSPITEDYKVVPIEFAPFDKDEKWLKKWFKAIDLKKDDKKKQWKSKVDVPLNKAGREYKYHVIIRGIGQLDPLVIVEE